MKGKIIPWIKTTRIQTGLVTALAFWVGYISVDPINIEAALFMTVIGLLVHIWGFTLNEVEDYKYDSKVEDASGHPIAQGKISPVRARYLAWVAGILSVIVSLIFRMEVLATVALIATFVPGYAYNKFSKVHWWSNIYLSAWVGVVVLTGALYAGSLTWVTALIAIAVVIQIFIQVVQGDLKDLEGPEKTLTERLGVKVVAVEAAVFTENGDEKQTPYKTSTDVTMYSTKFTALFYSLKSIEATILLYIGGVAADITSSEYVTGMDLASGYYLSLLVISIVFFVTASMVLVYVYDRGEIKRNASLHELTSIAFLGIALFPLDSHGGMLVAIAPLLWYIGVNSVIHSGMLNPDI